MIFLLIVIKKAGKYMSNYPDGTCEGDSRAPWNQPDPCDLYKCCECCNYHVIPNDIGNSDYGFCSCVDEYVKYDEEACFAFERAATATR